MAGPMLIPRSRHAPTVHHWPAHDGERRSGPRVRPAMVLEPRKRTAAGVPRLSVLQLCLKDDQPPQTDIRSQVQ